MTGEQLGIPPAALDPAQLHQAARAYCALGWPIVPAKAEGKQALVPWRRWQTVAPDLAAIDRWWHRWPWANVAVVTGQTSGVVVLDLDVRHGADRSLAELEQHAGDLPWQAVVETPSGGWHVYLRHPRFPVANSASRLGAGIDVRGDRGLALLPPSRRHLSAYRWAVGGPETVPVMPNGWRRLLRPPRPRPPAAPHVWSEPGVGRDAARLAGLVRTVAQAPERERNNTLYWAGRRLAEMIDQGAPAGWRAALERAGLHAGLPQREVAETLDSALGKQS
jgi:Bifunctional DNA primase/polymerase, N-terminal